MFTKKEPFFTEQSLAEYYNNRASKYKHSIKALQWQSEFNQYKRFEVIHSNIITECKSLCDLGCGYGDFYHFLQSINSSLSYTGIDISANMIVGAQRAYPNGKFQCTNIESLSAHHHFDVIIACGVFNLKMQEHHDYLYSQIQQMILKAKKQVLFNVLLAKSNRHSKSKQFVYFKKIELEKLLNKLPMSYQIIENYLPNDMTVSITL